MAKPYCTGYFSGFTVTNRSTKTVKLFHLEQFAIYGMSQYSNKTYTHILEFAGSNEKTAHKLSCDLSYKLQNCLLHVQGFHIRLTLASTKTSSSISEMLTEEATSTPAVEFPSTKAYTEGITMHINDSRKQHLLVLMVSLISLAGYH